MNDTLTAEEQQHLRNNEGYLAAKLIRTRTQKPFGQIQKLMNAWRKKHLRPKKAAKVRTWL